MAAPAPESRSADAEPRSFLESLDEVSEAVESGAGLPEVARAAGRALDASVIVVDAASSVLAVACASSEDERAVMAGEGGAETVELRVAELPVGQLRYRPRGEPPPGALLRLVGNLIGLEVDRAKAPERATEAAVGDFLQDLLARRLTDRENIVARAPRSASVRTRARQSPSSGPCGRARTTIAVAPPPMSQPSSVARATMFSRSVTRRASRSWRKSPTAASLARSGARERSSSSPIRFATSRNSAPGGCSPRGR